MKVCRNLKEGPHFIAENQTFFRNSAFSNTEVSLLFNQMFICQSNVYYYLLISQQIGIGESYLIKP